jgi:hypothetical protein
MIELLTGYISESTNHLLGFIKDIVLILGSLTTIFLALIGIKKWKREHKGKLRYEFSRMLLKTIYTLRDQFKGVRSPFISASEFSPNYKQEFNDEANNYRFVFTNRLKPLNETSNELLSILPEVELEFDKEVRKIFEDLLSQIQLYKMSLNEFIQLTGNTNNDDHYVELQNVVFSNTKEDKTLKEFESIVTKAEAEINKWMKKY